MGLAALLFATAGLAAENGRPSVAFAEFSFKDTSGEMRDQRAEHQAKLEMFTRLLRERVESGRKFAIADLECRGDNCAVTDGIASPHLTKRAAQQGVRFLVTGGVQKMSTLVQWARLTVLDLRSQRVALDRLYTFRGDTEEAWRHAALFAARHVNGMTPADLGVKSSDRQ